LINFFPIKIGKNISQNKNRKLIFWSKTFLTMNKPFTPLKNNQAKPTVGQLPRPVGNSASVIWRTVGLTALMLILLLSYNTTTAQVYCTMVCNDNLNISVGNECSVTIQYDQILEDGDNSRTCTPNGPTNM